MLYKPVVGFFANVTMTIVAKMTCEVGIIRIKGMEVNVRFFIGHEDQIGSLASSSMVMLNVLHIQ